MASGAACCVSCFIDILPPENEGGFSLGKMGPFEKGNESSFKASIFRGYVSFQDIDIDITC